MILGAIIGFLIGAGFGGMAAAWDLRHAGAEVTIFDGNRLQNWLQLAAIK